MIGNICKLRDVCKKIGSGSTPKGGSLIYLRDGIGFIRSQNVYNNFFEYSGYAHISDAAAAKLSSVEVYENDVLLNITGDSVARCCLVPKEALPARVNQHVAIIRADNRILNPRFLMYYMISPEMQAIMLGLAVGKGASRNALTKGLIEDFDIPLPDIATQNKIVELLSAYDLLIENNRKQIKLLEEAARRLYKEWFVDLRFPGHEHTPIVNGIPEGWRRGTLHDMADMVFGQSPKSDYYNKRGMGLPFHQGVASYGDRFVVDSVYTTKYSKAANPGSILFSVRAPVGRLNITRKQIAIGRGIAALNHKNGAQSFLYYLLKDYFHKEDIVGNGAIFASVSGDELRRFPIILPCDETIDRFNTVAKCYDEKIEIVNKQNELLTEARDRLLPKLMSGEIAIK